MQGSNHHDGDATRDPYLGLVIAGVFRLDELIGLGTTGRVYRATQLGFDRSVAVKLLHRHLMQASTIRERFHREARLASRLVHPGTVQVLASGELQAGGGDVGGEVYLVSEYLNGTSLRERLERGALSLVDSLSFMLAIADAVGNAHANHVIHRDLKPENFLSVAGDHVKTRHVVLDFGLARALDVQQDPLTHEGAVLGTPQYMSPEAARGEAATPRSDVYSLATVLYEMLAGHPPFDGASPLLVLMQQAEQEAPPIPPGLGVPQPVLALLRRELHKSPLERSADGTTFALQLIEAAKQSNLALSRLVTPQLSELISNHIGEISG